MKKFLGNNFKHFEKWLDVVIDKFTWSLYTFWGILEEIGKE